MPRSRLSSSPKGDIGCPRAAKHRRPQPSAATRRLRGERGFTLIEVLVTCLVLVVGLLGLFETLDVAARTTMTNRQRQAETSLARELIEDARTLAYTQLTPSALAGALQPLVAGSTVSGQGLSVARSIYTFNVSLNVCSLDDPTDGYGNHSAPPASGGVWCPDVAPNGTADSNPDDYKRLSVTVTPHTGTEPTVELTTLIYAQTVNGPAVSCLTVTQGSCPGTNQAVTSSSTSSLTFYVTTTAQAASLQWHVNGNPPPSAQVATGATDPYIPSATSSQFTWTLPQADGTYAISAYAQDSLGNTGSRSTLQVTVNRHQATAPASITAGYNGQISGVDVQWLPSTDQDILYYNVYHQVGTGASALACSHVTGTSCTDMTAPNPGTPPSQCTNPPTDYTSQPNVYWIVGVDTDPTTGQPRLSSQTSQTSDANLCDHPPSSPSNLTATVANGALTLNWSAPAAPGDPDPGDSIQGWRVYRWTSGSNVSFPGSRLAYVGGVNGTQTVTSFIDSSPDPNGVTQNYCVTSVDTHLNESPCSNVATG
jgi:prepilin-type N-terminal cleavage/methylation domain-containing protein